MEKVINNSKLFHEHALISLHCWIDTRLFARYYRVVDENTAYQQCRVSKRRVD